MWWFVSPSKHEISCHGRGRAPGCFDVFLVLSPNSVSTLRGSYGRSKGRCLIRVLTLGRGIFPVNFRIKWLLWNPDMRFDCAGSHKVCGAVLACSILLLNFRIKWLLWNLDMHFDYAGSHTVCFPVFLLNILPGWGGMWCYVDHGVGWGGVGC